MNTLNKKEIQINSFKISKLHRNLNFEFKFTDNTLVLLGENGSCKTTIMKILYYTFSCQWSKLIQFDFENIELNINDKPFLIEKKYLLQNGIRLNEYDFYKLHVPLGLRRKILTIQTREEYVNLENLFELCESYEFPIEKIIPGFRDEDYLNIPIINDEEKELFKKNISSLEEEIKNLQILYLPTYRRIEKDLEEVLEGRVVEKSSRYNRYGIEDTFYERVEYRQNSRFAELVEFGMSDVENALQETLFGLKDFHRSNLNQLTLEYLGDIVEKKYNKITQEQIENIQESTIHEIIGRVDESILSKQKKEKLINTLLNGKKNNNISDYYRVIYYYYMKLQDSHTKLVYEEKNIQEFIKVCNNYLENKEIYYDSINFEYNIKIKNTEEIISLSELSSGEKQVISLFSYLYLSQKTNCIVLIDEPELSLSVKWQEIFLEDIYNCNFCKGLIAVTHSPFTFNNSLDDYAHGIEEFRI